MIKTAELEWSAKQIYANSRYILLILVWDIPKTFKGVKNGTSCSVLSTQICTGWPSVRIIWLGVVSCRVWGMILQWTLSSLSQPVCDMTEKLLKVTLNPDKQQQQNWNWHPRKFRRVGDWFLDEYEASYQLGHIQQYPDYMSHIMRNLLMPYAHSLISAFVVHCLDCIIPLNFYIQNFKPLASFCGCSGRFESTLVTNFLVMRLILTWKFPALG